jgi:hypothetical protein
MISILCTVRRAAHDENGRPPAAIEMDLLRIVKRGS